MKRKFIFDEHVDFFVSKCKDFLTQNLDKKIDLKHENLLVEFKKIYKKGFTFDNFNCYYLFNWTLFYK